MDNFISIQSNDKLTCQLRNMRAINYILLFVLALHLLIRNVNSSQDCVCSVLRYEVSSLQEETESLHDNFALCKRAELDALKTVDDLRQQLKRTSASTDCPSHTADNVAALEKERSLLKQEQKLLKDKLEYFQQQLKKSHSIETALQSELNAALDQVRTYEEKADGEEDDDDDDDIEEDEDEEILRVDAAAAAAANDEEREHLTSTIAALEQQLQSYEAMIHSLKQAKSSELLQLQQQLEAAKQEIYSTRGTSREYKAKYDQLAEHHATVQDQLTTMHASLTGLVEAIAVREKYEQMLVEKGAMLREREAEWLPYWLRHRFSSLGGTTSGTEMLSEVVGTVGTAGKKMVGTIKQSIQQVYTQRIAPLLPPIHTSSTTRITTIITTHLSTACHAISSLIKKSVGPGISWLPDKHRLKTTSVKFWKLRVKPALKAIEASVEKVAGEGYVATVALVKQGVAKATGAAKDKMMKVEDAVVERLSVSLAMPFVTINIYRMVVRGVIVVGMVLWGLVVVIALLASRRGSGRKRVQVIAVPPQNSEQKADKKKKKQQLQRSTKPTEGSSEDSSKEVRKSENGDGDEIAAAQE
jgi:hypothetical protein